MCWVTPTCRHINRSFCYTIAGVAVKHGIDYFEGKLDRVGLFSTFRPPPMFPLSPVLYPVSCPFFVCLLLSLSYPSVHSVYSVSVSPILLSSVRTLSLPSLQKLNGERHRRATSRDSSTRGLSAPSREISSRELSARDLSSRPPKRQQSRSERGHRRNESVDSAFSDLTVLEAGLKAKRERTRGRSLERNETGEVGSDDDGDGSGSTVSRNSRVRKGGRGIEIM